MTQIVTGFLCKAKTGLASDYTDQLIRLLNDGLDDDYVRTIVAGSVADYNRDFEAEGKVQAFKQSLLHEMREAVRLSTVERVETYRGNMRALLQRALDSLAAETAARRVDNNYLESMVDQGIPLLAVCILKLDLDLDQYLYKDFDETIKQSDLQATCIEFVRLLCLHSPMAVRQLCAARAVERWQYMFRMYPFTTSRLLVAVFEASPKTLSDSNQLFSAYT